jgi:hypothetical protein
MGPRCYHEARRLRRRGREQLWLTTTIDTTATRAKFERLAEDQRRSFPHLDEASHLGSAWRLLNREERHAILADDLGEGDDAAAPTFKAENVDVEKLASFLLEVRSELISKTQPGLSREAAFAAACEAHPEIFKAARAARRAQLVAGNVEEPAEGVAKRIDALQLLTAKANEIRKAEPTLSIEAARVEAHRRFPDIAGRERA